MDFSEELGDASLEGGNQLGLDRALELGEGPARRCEIFTSGSGSAISSAHLTQP